MGKGRAFSPRRGERERKGSGREGIGRGRDLWPTGEGEGVNLWLTGEGALGACPFSKTHQRPQPTPCRKAGGEGKRRGRKRVDGRGKGKEGGGANWRDERIRREGGRRIGIRQIGANPKFRGGCSVHNNLKCDYPRDAMLARVLAIATCLYVPLCVFVTM